VSETNPAGAKAVAVAAKAARRTTLLRILFSSEAPYMRRE
jgi:hypothetical protein